MDNDGLKKFANWVADYTDPVDVCLDNQLRQITSKGVVPGITGYVDIDITSIDYIDIMKKNGLNGFTKQKERKKK